MSIEDIASVVMVVGFSILFVIGLLSILAAKIRMDEAINSLKNSIDEWEDR